MLGAILLLFISIILLGNGLHYIKKGYTFIPIIYIYKEKNPIVFWIIAFSYLFFGAWLLIGLILTIAPS